MWLWLKTSYLAHLIGKEQRLWALGTADQSTHMRKAFGPHLQAQGEIAGLRLALAAAEKSSQVLVVLGDLPRSVHMCLWCLLFVVFMGLFIKEAKEMILLTKNHACLFFGGKMWQGFLTK